MSNDLKIKKIIHEVLKEKNISKEVNNDTNLQELGINSLDLIKVIVSIEEEYSIEFDDSDLLTDRFVDIQSIVAYVETLVIES